MSQDLLQLPVVETPQPQGNAPSDESLWPDINTHLPLPIDQMPPIFRELLATAPRSRRLPVFIATMPMLMALATRVRLHYRYDSRPSALLVQTIIEGPQSSGKSFAAYIEHLLMEPTLRRHDREERYREQDWNELKERVGDSEKMPPMPKTLIRCIPPDISKKKLGIRANNFERMTDGDWVTFWRFSEELQLMTDARRNNYSDLRAIDRLSYDVGARYSMDYAGPQSVPFDVDLNICSLFCGTRGAVNRYMDNGSVEGGNVTRCIISEIDDAGDDPIFRPLTDEERATIKRYLRLMMADAYTADNELMPVINLDTSWLDHDVKSWIEARNSEVQLSGSAAFKAFKNRSSCSAFRIAALCKYLYDLELREVTLEERDQQEPMIEKRCKKIYQFMADYILNSLLERWGAQYDDLIAKQNKHYASASRIKGGIYALLPDVFTRKMFEDLWKREGKVSPARQTWYRWRFNGNITQLEDGSFRKVHKKQEQKQVAKKFKKQERHDDD